MWNCPADGLSQKPSNNGQKGSMQEQRNDTSCDRCLSALKRRNRHGLTIREQAKYACIHNLGTAEVKWGVLAPIGFPPAETLADGARERVGLYASLRRGRKAVQRIGWLAVRTWR